MYCLLLDTSQAFDRVHYIKLFKLLFKSSLSFVFIYLTKIKNKMGKTKSCEFSVKNRGKQGGSVVYTIVCFLCNELLLQLQASLFGSYIGPYFVGALVYADNVTLLGPTLTFIKLMLYVVKPFGDR